ncbi:MAG TPA: DUF1360 domain-containing protein [Candidatus Paceibacterota bacterium]|nr:DUF1360 domain-containing protein [Candidatus Paceibacterota bacterium]
MKAFWNILYSVFFIGLITVAFLWLSERGQLIADIPVFHLVLLSLATFRLVRLFTYDHITDYLRDWVRTRREDSFLGTAGSLLGCPWCTGMWFAFLAYVGYAAAPAVVLPLALILSIAAAASLFQLVANLIGWSAEATKRDVTQI